MLDPTANCCELAVLSKDAARLRFQIKRVAAQSVGKSAPIGERLDLLRLSTGAGVRSLESGR